MPTICILYRDQSEQLEVHDHASVNDVIFGACRLFSIERPEYFGLLYNGILLSANVNMIEMLQQKISLPFMLIQVRQPPKEDMDSPRMEPSPMRASNSDSLASKMKDPSSHFYVPSKSTPSPSPSTTSSLATNTSSPLRPSQTQAPSTTTTATKPTTTTTTTTTTTASPSSSDLSSSPWFPVRAFEEISKELWLLVNGPCAVNSPLNTLRMLFRIINTILLEPEDQAKRSLNYKSKSFEEKIGCSPNALEVLNHIGFRPIMTDKGERLFLEDSDVDITLLVHVGEVISKCVGVLESIETAVTTPSVSSDIVSSPMSTSTPTPTDTTPPLFNPFSSVAIPPLSTTHPPANSCPLTTEEVVAKRESLIKALESKVPQRRTAVFVKTTNFNPRKFGGNVQNENDNKANTSVEQKDDKLTPEDRRLLCEYTKRKTDQMESDKQFKTKAYRESEQLKKLQVYESALVRVILPENVVFQAFFAPRETVKDICDAICSVLSPPFNQLPFKLSTLYPKIDLNLLSSLRGAGLVPTAVLYLSWLNGPPQGFPPRGNLSVKKLFVDGVFVEGVPNVEPPKLLKNPLV